MASRRERGHPEWQAIIAEHQVLKRKLQSKSEALLIISKDLDTARNERDQFKLMAEKLQERCQAFKRQQAEMPLTNDKAKLVQLLKEAKNQKLHYQKQCEQLTQKVSEASGDIKLLREKFARKTVGDEGIGSRHFPPHERETLVAELEESQQQSEHWKREYEIQLDTVSETESELAALRQKVERLNQELSFIVTGDKRRIIDVDALCMENKYLQDRITQCQEEKNSLHAQINKYKAALSARKSSKADLLKPGHLRAAGVVVSPKQLKQMLARGCISNEHGNVEASPQQVADLQSIVSALLETINDKNLALHHLRNTNKILGTRVSDLERKLKTLEVGGLWNLHDSETNPTINGVGDEEEITRTPALGNPDAATDVSPTDGAPERRREPPVDEYINSLGSRLSKITDCCEAVDTCQLVSMTTIRSNGGSDAASGDESPASDDITSQGHDAAATAADVSREEIDGWLCDVNSRDNVIAPVVHSGDESSQPDGNDGTSPGGTGSDVVARVAEDVTDDVGSPSGFV